MTDLHLNFLDRIEREAFYDRVLDEEPGAALLTGDLGEAPSTVNLLREMAEALGIPLYFVLGNHDFYRGSVASVRAQVERLCREEDHLHWLPTEGIVSLGATALVGHDGWADGRYGDWWGTGLMLNDYFCIGEFIALDKAERLCVMQSLADEAANHFQRSLPEAFRYHRSVLLLTHVPPFPEICRHKGRPSDNGGLPHFASKVVGDVLRATMAARTDRRLTVLCGHTHSRATAKILPNLLARCGGAEYGKPRVQRIFQVGGAEERG
jgi:hypothetical protein